MTGNAGPEASLLQMLRRTVARPLFQAIAVATVVFAVYLRTLAPTVMWYDMGEFATAALTLGIAHNTGYPLFMLLGKLFSYLPLGDPAYRINLMSAFFAASTVAVTYLYIWRLTESRAIAALSSLLLGFSSTLWGNATWAEVYSINALLTVSILVLLESSRRSGKPRTLYWACFLLGLGLGNHRLLLAVALPIGYAGLLRFGAGWQRPLLPRITRMAAFFLVGFAINLYLPIRAAQNPPVLWADATDPGIFLQMVTTGKANVEAFYNPFGDLGRIEHWVRILSLYPAYELTLPGLAISLLGAFICYRRATGIFLLTVMVAGFSLVFVSTYGIHDIFNYFLPLYQMMVVWWAFAALASLEWLRASPRLKVLRGIAGPAVRQGLLLALLAWIPMRLFAVNYPVLDRSEHWDTRTFAQLVWSTVEPGAYVLADFWTWTPMLYEQAVLGEGQGITLVPAISENAQELEALLADLEAGGVPVYLTTRYEDTPGNRLGPYSLRLLSPYPVQGLPTDSQPLPSYKDRLVPRGAIYRVGRGQPELDAEGVPLPAQILESTFGNEIVLRAFSDRPARVKPGDVLELTFYWELPRAIDRDLWAEVVFTDERGRVQTEAGIPRWQASHWIGGGSRPTSSWEQGTLVEQTLQSLVPVEVSEGRYQIRLLVYGQGPRQGLLPAEPADPDAVQGVILGEVVITTQ